MIQRVMTGLLLLMHEEYIMELLDRKYTLIQVGDENQAPTEKNESWSKKDFKLNFLREARMGPGGFEPPTNWL